MEFVMKFRYPLAIFLLGSLSTLAFASEELAKKNYCFGCHLMDGKMVGPSFKEVAAKYAGQEGALTKVTQTVREGGSGKWGQIPMPAQSQLSADEAKALAAWILTLTAPK
jgi:cytochrome c